jgi:hypothetical protein
MFILQTILIHVYHLKDDTTMPKANPRTVMLTLECFQRRHVSGFSLHVLSICPLRYGWPAAAPWQRLFLHAHGLRDSRYG